MKRFLNKFLFVFVLLLESSVLLSASEKLNKGGFVKDLCEIPISTLVKNGEVGKLVDVKYPTEFYPCFIFVFTNQKYMYEVMANSENMNYLRLEEMSLDEYISLGFLRVTNLKTKKTYDFFFKGNEKSFVFLNNLERYTSIAELESQIHMDFVKVDKGGFLFPFYTYIYKKDSHILEIICSPNMDKTKSYFVGGWSYH